MEQPLPLPLTPQTLEHARDRERAKELAEAVCCVTQRDVLRALGSRDYGWLYLAGFMYRWRLSDASLNALAHNQPEVVAHMASIIDPLYYEWELSTYMDTNVLTIRTHAAAKEPARDYWAELKTWYTALWQ